MTTPVKLYVYDLSRGMARQMSRQLTGRQIDGIWHTSVVVFGKEVFYGHGISVTPPTQSHHGTPLQILDMGETAIDEEIWNEYLIEMREHYTAEKYHLLDFNCNSFTQDCINFLTGGSIPQHIRELPRDFLATPFGQALRPSIDNMYRRPNVAGPPSIPPSLPPSAANTLLNSVAAHAQRPSEAFNPQHAARSYMHHIYNPSNFSNLLENHKAVIGFFTSKTCPPCRMIEPAFVRLAEQKGVAVGEPDQNNRAVFAKIDLDVGMAGSVAQKYSVRATPTFIFFLNGSKSGEMKGANLPGLESEVNFLLYQAFPPHPHHKLNINEIRSISLDPILFTQTPPWDTINSKLSATIDAATIGADEKLTKEQIKATISNEFVTYLKTQKPESTTTGTPTLPVTPHFWGLATQILLRSLPLESIFPLIDMWRVALLDAAVAAWAVTSDRSPLLTFLRRAKEEIDSEKGTLPRNYLLVSLRLLLNAFKLHYLGSAIAKEGETRELATAVLVSSLLHDDTNVRSAAAGVAFNIAAGIQKRRTTPTKTAGGGGGGQQEDEGWEVELVSAIVEALDREKTSEDVVHRLVASLALLIHLSPSYESISELLGALRAREILKGKLEKGGCGEKGVVKKEVRKLIEVTARELCPES